ncbi:hypothetical protein C8R45DRAFT_1135093, partial [Mycena sanguinolenta]
FSILPLPLFFHLANALLNVTIDDTNPNVVYNGAWEPSSSHQSSLDYGGSHTLSSDNNANALVTFTGVAIHYLAPLWPYPVFTDITLDDNQVFTVNLTDPNSPSAVQGAPESAMYSVRWSATNLNNTAHTVVLTI